MQRATMQDIQKLITKATKRAKANGHTLLPWDRSTKFPARLAYSTCRTCGAHAQVDAAMPAGTELDITGQATQIDCTR